MVNSTSDGIDFCRKCMVPPVVKEHKDCFYLHCRNCGDNSEPCKLRNMASIEWNKQQRRRAVI